MAQQHGEPIAVDALVLDGEIVLYVRGEVDISTVGVLRDALSSALSQRPARLILELAELEFIDVLGARELLRARASLPPEHCAIVLSHPRPGARRLFELMGLDGPCVIEG